MHKINIVVANYNSGDDIKKTLISLSKCNLIGDSVTLVDNISTDGSYEIANKIIKTFNSTNYFYHESDDGVYDALNKGIFSVNSEYVLILHSGDEIIPKTYNYLKSIISSFNNKKILIFTRQLLNRKGNIDVRSSHIPAIRYKMSICHSNIIIPRYLYSKYGKYNTSFKIASDFKLIREILLSGELFIELDLPLIINDTSGLSNNIKYLPYSLVENIKSLINRQSSRKDFIYSGFYLFSKILYFIKKKFN